MRKYHPEGKLMSTPENIAALSSEGGLQAAMQSGQIVEARAELCDFEHNLTVDLGCMRGFIPRSEAAMGITADRSRDISVISRVNRPVCFKVQGFFMHRGCRTALLSRALAQSECFERYISRLDCGRIISAVITHNEGFGSFADIGCGIIALLPIDCISVSRISHPADRLRPGQEILAAVKSVDGQGRVCLTHKELLGTWEENAAAFSAGQTCSGIIRSVEDYGVFVELQPNLAGLAESREGAAVGQLAGVFIKSIIPSKMKIKLVIIDSFMGEHIPYVPRYYVEGDRIDVWRYSPLECEKIIESRFIPNS